MTTLLASTVALEGDMIEHAGLTDTSLEALIAAAEAGEAAYQAVDRSDDEATATASGLRHQTQYALANYEVADYAELDRKRDALLKLGVSSEAVGLCVIGDYARFGMAGRASCNSSSDPTWDKLRAASSAAWAAFGEATNLTDAVALGREPTEAEEAAYEAANAATQEATRAVAEYPVRSLAQLAEKHEALLGVALDDEDIVEALGRDILRLRRAELLAPRPLLSTASLAQFDAWESEYDRLVALECGTVDVTPEGHAEATRLCALSKVQMNHIIETPCADLGAAIAKLKWLRLAFTDGETGRELEVVEQIEGFFRALAGDTAREVSCPVAALLPSLEEAAQMEAVAAEQGDAAESTRWGDRRDELEVELSRLAATSRQGAQAQLAVALHMAELVRGNNDPRIRDGYHDHLEDLLVSALRVFGDALPDVYWDAYVPGGRAPISVAA